MNSPDTVLSIDLICDCICTVMPLEDLKQFRLVCRKWKDISERTFKKRICFDFHSNRTNKFIQHPVPEDLNAFFRTSQMTYPFTALRFTDILPWTNSALIAFFSTEGKYITNLMLHDVKWKNDEGEDTANELQNIGVEAFYLMSIFSGIDNLEKLDIQCYFGNATRFALTQHDLARVQCIHLKHCIVEVTDRRITPKELEFELLTFVQGGKILDSVLLNDFVNFTLMEKLTTYAALNLSRLPECKTTKMKLNLYGREKVKFVKVRHCVLRDGVLSYDIVDFRNSSWEIETLDLFSIQFQQTNNMIIRNISMHRTQFSPHHFPQSLQKLCLTDEIEFPENLQWAFFLPKLKILELTGTNTINTVFPHLLNCFPNLVALKLKSGLNCTNIAEIDINLIPPHVQKILFNDYRNHFVFVGDGVRAVQTLFLQKANSNFAVNMCNHFVPINLIVFVEKAKKEYKVDMEKSLFVALSKICDKGIIFGLSYHKYIWHGKDEDDDFVFPIVDMPGEFYSYINGRRDVIKWKYDAKNKSPLTFSQFQSFLNSSGNIGNGK